MSMSVASLLQDYLANDFTDGWCLAMVISKEGSSYRTPGAMMLIDPLGQASGMVSGGCLEADVVRRSRQVLSSNQPRYVEYDMLDDESFAAELGIGCRGKIGIFIQPLDYELHQLLTLQQHELHMGRACFVVQQYDRTRERQPTCMALLDSSLQLLAASITAPDLPTFNPELTHQIVVNGHHSCSITKVLPATNLLVIGGGADARPLVAMADILGWRTTVLDQRPAYASRRFFPTADRIIRKRPEEIERISLQTDAVVVLTHNLKLDAAWLKWLFSEAPLPSYIGLLGPHERKQQVLNSIAGIDQALMQSHVRGPVGLDLGGELPESIALAILADIHAVLLGGRGTPKYSIDVDCLRQIESI